KQIPFMRFRFVGNYTPITDTANAAGVDYTSFMAPLGVNRTNTPTWSIHGYTGCLQSLSVDLANNLIYRNLVGCSGADITDRAPTGNAVLELPTVAGFNFADKVAKATLDEFTVTHG